MMDRSQLRNLPLPEPFLLGIAAGICLQRLRPLALPGSGLSHHLVGLTLIVAGITIIVRSLRAAAHLDLDNPDRLVTSGPYALSRNPMYLGWALLHLGVGVGSGAAWIVAAVPVAAGWVHRDVLHEERVLDKEFSAEYGRYRRAVPRYLPSWRRPLNRHSHAAG
jgi:protein-S-isoprenylcysteine O-methyltransferase Ste14